MIPVTTAQMREIDRRAIEEFDIKGEVLMERAGSGVTSAVRRIAEVAGLLNPVILLIAGRGQNGGDAFVAARQLKEEDFHVEVWIAAHGNQISGDALLHLSRMKAAGIEPTEIPTLEDWQVMLDDPFYADIIVDGVLGTGLKGPPRGPAAGAVQYIREKSPDSLVVAIDIPSGLDGDTGVAEGDAVIADMTVTVGLPKTGLLAQCAIDYVGTLDVVDIGIPPEFCDELTSVEGVQFLHLTDLKRLIKRRRRNTHKGDYGHVLVVGGSVRHGGAALLCARAALRAGAGLVTALVPARFHAAIIANTPEIMVWPGIETADGALSAANLAWLLEVLPAISAVVVGPGLTVCDDTRALVEGLLAQVKVPVVLDADALTLFAGQADRLRRFKDTALVLTPHPGELGRLTGQTAAAIQHDRLQAVREAVVVTGATVALKGAGTLVAGPDFPVQVNLCGNPGMATAGSGDVLAGVIGGLLAQHFSPYDAARTGVYIHGRAGDYGAWRRCQSSLMAGDIVEEIPYALRDLALR